ncbi:hypothetical protein LX16_0799 [Stackebrandtia albiflava]|uniref:WD40 repeat protein n=1 Tax=Stackebrandtia albiflava TaxID=406432 RepID=A0A562VB84_9ACTN|nr:hypothetical protein [Stackebrandtia albiflava]TWJ15101.1 hypothetical protein LX16_0799 [Stackebrandtia albiflava]
MNRRLSQVLRDGTVDLTVPDFADVVIARSGRMRRSRRLSAVAAATALVVGVVGATFTVRALTDPGDPGGTLAGQFQYTTEPTGAVASELTEWTALPDRLVYANYDTNPPATATVVTPDAVESVVLPYPATGPGDLYWKASPNGRNLAAVTPEGLHVGALDETADPLVYPATTLCTPFTWSPDSAKLVIGDCADESISLVVVDAISGSVTVIDTAMPSVPPDSSHQVSALWTADAGNMVWGNTAQGYVIADADGTDPRPFDAGGLPTDPAEIYPAELLEVRDADGPPRSVISAISADGSRVCHEVWFGDDPMMPEPLPPMGEEAGCNYLLDVPTGRAVDLGDAWYTAVIGISAHGQILTRSVVGKTDEAKLVELRDANGRVIDGFAETVVPGGDGQAKGSQNMLMTLYGHTD